MRFAAGSAFRFRPGGALVRWVPSCWAACGACCAALFRYKGYKAVAAKYASANRPVLLIQAVSGAEIDDLI